MKKTLILFISSLTVIILAFASVWLFYSVVLPYCILPLKYILQGELLLFRNELEQARQLFPRFYFAHTVFVRIGTPLLLLFLLFKLLPPLKKSISKLISLLWRKTSLHRYKKELCPGISVLILTGFAVISVLIWKEYELRKQGWPPGQFYHSFVWVDSVTADNQPTISDSTGLIHLNPLFEWDDPYYTVNSQGFISTLEFTTATADSLSKLGKKKVMVIGDSFTQGRSPGGYKNTFMVLLGKPEKNYEIFNFGVTGTDPLQYLQVIIRFLPVIKPDLVIINFCGANDIMEHDRELTPYIPLIWATNAGGLASNPPCMVTGREGVVLKTPQEAYECYRKVFGLPEKKDAGLLVKMCSRLSITTALYRKFFNKTKFFECKPQACDASYYYLHQSDSICAMHNVPLKILFIPDLKYIDKVTTGDDFREKYSSVFHDLTPQIHFPEGFNKEDFGDRGDYHFSDKGNARFAPFIDSVISSALSRPPS